MAKCLNCENEVPQIEGKRQRLYCNDACRKAYKRKQTRTPLPDKSITGQAVTGNIGHIGTDFSKGQLVGEEYPIQHYNPMMVGYVPLPKGED